MSFEDTDLDNRISDDSDESENISVLDFRNIDLREGVKLGNSEIKKFKRKYPVLKFTLPETVALGYERLV